MQGIYKGTLRIRILFFFSAGSTIFVLREPEQALLPCLPSLLLSLSENPGSASDFGSNCCNTQ